MIVLQELIWFGSDLFYSLYIVPPLLCNARFACFHTNLLRGHMTAYRMHTCLCLRYYWPGIDKYCMRRCKQCPGCALSTSTMKINKLLYKFQINKPFDIFHVDGYKAGAHVNFKALAATPLLPVA